MSTSDDDMSLLLRSMPFASVLGIEEVTKQERQLSKALNFGLLYGMGAAGLFEVV